MKDNNNDGETGSELYGRTMGGKVFKVPKTRDMLLTLFQTKRQPSLFSLITLIILALNIISFFILPSNIKGTYFLILFLFWRVGYNGFLGYLLYSQSNYSFLVRLCTKMNWLDDKSKIGKWIKKQLELEMGDDYEFESVPAEFNTWLLFRRLVDLILVNDFTTYLLFALANFKLQSEWSLWENLLRYFGASLLIIFNLIVKLDAHRVVKDFAWYWGDFFFVIEQKLTFDGVFELAPHPMYSLGYAGYYGISLLTASPIVFYISLLAHSAQFIFLVWVENPHIEKTYPQADNQTEEESKVQDKYEGDVNFQDGERAGIVPKIQAIYQPYMKKSLDNHDKFDPFKASDLFSAFLTFYGFLLVILSWLSYLNLPMITIIQYLSLIHALIWRFIHSIGLGCFVLGQQSKNKRWTRHFIKIGLTPVDAFKEWKIIYNLSSTMTYLSFITAAITFYNLNNGLLSTSPAIRHTFGTLLIILHIWTSASVYEVLHDYGWYYGDFFLDLPGVNLNYTGIYRYLNNPEKIIGHAAFYGIALISNSATILLLAISSHICYFIFYYLVESPHMEKLYKGKLRKEAGVTKTVKTAAQTLKSNLKHNKNLSIALSSIEFTEKLIDKLEKGVESSINETKEALGGIVKKTKPHVMEFIEDTEKLLNQSKIKLAETRERLLLNIDQDIPTEYYSIELSEFRENNLLLPAKYELGQPIKITLKVPYGKKHKYDWVGLYKVAANPSSTLTTVSSQNRYLYTHPPVKSGNENEVTDSSGLDTEASSGDESQPINVIRDISEQHHYLSVQPLPFAQHQSQSNSKWCQVELVFSHKKLFYEPNIYEFRLHKGNGHKVIAISRPFEILAPKADKLNSIEQIRDFLIPYVARCLDIDSNEEELEAKVDNLFYNSLDSVYTSRLVTLIKVAFNIEFDEDVIESHSNLITLAQRILEAQQVLKPFFVPTPKMKPIHVKLDSPILNKLDE